MVIKKPIPISFNLDGQYSVQSVCAVIHIDDKNTETLDLSLMQGGEHIAVSPNSTVTARFVRVKDKILISDNVPCAVQENGNIHIPIDNAAAHMLVGEIKIEVNIVDENDILTMQFPLVIRVNNTILADAEISPESEGTIPELLEEAREAAESATQAAKAATEAISTKQDKLTAGENITIEGNVISAEGCGSQIVSGEVNANGTITFTDSEDNSFTTSGESVIGQSGADGYSPTVTVQQTASGTTVTITDKSGTTTADITNGTNGTDGKDGKNGTDGYSPSASVNKSGNTATITITDKSGTTTASISDGVNGTNGKDGTNGADGFSPLATVTKSGTVSTITITDKNGTTAANVNDGANGSNGTNGISCTHSWDGTTLSVTSASGTSSADLKGEKGDKGDDYVLTSQDKAEIAGMVDVSGEVDAKINGIIPDYWESAVDTAISKVKTIQRAHGADCINLVWFSDIHLMASIGNSNFGRNIPALARRLINKLDIPFVISTGDSATNSVESTKTAMRADFDYFNKLIRSAGISDKLINCFGNHDGAWGDNRQGTEGYIAAYAWHIRPRDYWNDLIRKQTIGADRHYSADGTYGYVDLPAQKLRIIQLNSFWVGDNDTYYSNGTMIFDYMHHGGYGQAQLDWLADEALRFDEEGWSVLFLAHMPPALIDSTDYTAAANNRDALIMNGILNAYANKTTYQGSYTYNAGRNEGAWANVSVNVDFSSESHYAKPIAFLAGHCHKSRIINDVLPFPIITITCATNSSYDSSTEGSRTNNTATETAFDVISICKDEEKIYLTRLGVGSDRETSYTPVSPVINQIPISTDENGNIYNGTGYKDGYRYNSSNKEAEAAGYFTTGRIPVKNGDVVALDGFVFPQTTVSGGANVNYCRIIVYKSGGAVSSTTSDQVAANYGGIVVDNQITKINIDTSKAFYSNIEYIAFSGYGSGANAAIYIE